MRPRRRQPTRLPRPWDSPGKNTGVGCHFLLQCRKVKSWVAETLVNQHSRQIKLRGGATPYCARGGAYTPPPLVFNSHPALSLNLDSFESPERVCWDHSAISVIWVKLWQQSMKLSKLLTIQKIHRTFILPFLNYISRLSVSIFAEQRKPLWQLSPPLCEGLECFMSILCHYVILRHGAFKQRYSEGASLDSMYILAWNSIIYWQLFRVSFFCLFFTLKLKII